MAKRGYEEPKVEANLTPMIDVTFLLIMFFMIVSDLAALNLEPLQLPKASACSTEKGDLGKENSIIINVLGRKDEHGPIIRIQGIRYIKNAKNDQLTPFLRRYVAINAGIEQPEKGQPKPVENILVLIRADYMTEFDAIHRVMDSLQHVGLYKITLGALKEELHPVGG